MERQSTMKAKTKVMVEIKSLLKDLPMHEQIEVVERLGKQLRQANSIQTAKEIDQFSRRVGTKKQIDKYPINGQIHA